MIEEIRGGRHEANLVRRTVMLFTPPGDAIAPHTWSHGFSSDNLVQMFSKLLTSLAKHPELSRLSAAYRLAPPGYSKETSQPRGSTGPTHRPENTV